MSETYPFPCLDIVRMLYFAGSLSFLVAICVAAAAFADMPHPPWHAVRHR